MAGKRVKIDITQRELDAIVTARMVVRSHYKMNYTENNASDPEYEKDIQMLDQLIQKCRNFGMTWKGM